MGLEEQTIEPDDHEHDVSHLHWGDPGAYAIYAIIVSALTTLLIVWWKKRCR